MTEVKTQLNTEIAKKHCLLAAAILLVNGKISLDIASISHLEALCLRLNVTSIMLHTKKKP